MNWQTLCEDPVLRELPYKIETDRWNHIVMSPASNRHAAYQGMIAALIHRQTDQGLVLTECSIQTSDGVKVADVAWVSNSFLQRHHFANPYSEAPEVVVEVISPSNPPAEMDYKRELYFAQGAQEFWLCADDGALSFFNHHAALETSVLFPAFPQRLELPV